MMASCQNEPKFTNETKPGSNGRQQELLVVCDDDLWEGPTGDTVRAILQQDFPWLNQIEPRHDLIHRNFNDFNNTYATFRNILILKLSSDAKVSKVTAESDLYAKPQQIIQITGPSGVSIRNKMMEMQETILERFDQNELRRMAMVMRKINKPSLAEEVKKACSVKISVPQNYYIAKKEENFIWVRKVIPNMQQETSFTVSVYNYTDTSQLNPKNIIAVKDSILKEHVPISDAITYMGTELRYGPESRVIDFKGAYTVETRGFWRAYGNYITGGPFVNYMIHDEKNNRLIMFDGYVRKHNENKRDLLRQLEGIAWTIEL